MKTTYLIGLSGPPRSGKDTLGNLVAGILREKDVPVEVHALSLPMRLAVYGMLGLEYSVEHYEANKDTPFTTGSGGVTTIRQEMISLSEDHVKPRLGNDWWGYALLNRTRLALASSLSRTWASPPSMTCSSRPSARAIARGFISTGKAATSPAIAGATSARVAISTTMTTR